MAMNELGANTRWLSDFEQQTWRRFLQGTQMLFERLGSQLQAESGLSGSDYDILVILSEAESGSVRMCDLAERSVFSRSRLSHAVNRLEKLGWVERVSCPTDGRGTFAVITDKGRRVLEDAAPGHVEMVRKLLFDSLDDVQVAELHQIMGSVLNAISDDDKNADDHMGADCEDSPISGE